MDRSCSRIRLYYLLVWIQLQKWIQDIFHAFLNILRCVLCDIFVHFSRNNAWFWFWWLISMSECYEMWILDLANLNYGWFQFRAMEFDNHQPRKRLNLQIRSSHKRAHLRSGLIVGQLEHHDLLT